MKNNKTLKYKDLGCYVRKV